jgi:hypothetical protein
MRLDDAAFAYRLEVVTDETLFQPVQAPFGF